MPAITYTVVTLSLTIPQGDPTVPATNGDLLPNDGLTFLYFKNTNTAGTTQVTPSSRTNLTVPGYGVVNFTDTAITIPVGGTLLVGPFAPSRFNDPANGLVTLNYALGTGGSLLVKAVRFTPIA